VLLPLRETPIRVAPDSHFFTGCLERPLPTVVAELAYLNGRVRTAHLHALVRKQCTPRTESVSVRSECKDENGFKRTCTKNVAGDVVGYVCPKTMDAEAVQLGLYLLLQTPAGLYLRALQLL